MANPILRRNLEALERVDRALHRRMVERTPGGRCEVAASSSGHPTAIVATEAGAVALAGQDDPMAEAVALVGRLELPPCEALFISGFALGYHVAALEHVARDHAYFVYEADEDVFRVALEHGDLVPVLERAKTRFFVGQDDVGLLAWLRDAVVQADALEVATIEFAPSMTLHPDVYAAARATLQTVMDWRSGQIGTLVGAAEEVEHNALRNVAALAESEGVADFAGRFAGLPAVVVAAGPSLAELIPDLRRAAERCVIIAVGKALRLLLAEGIAPDFVVAVDMTEPSAAVFEGLEIPAKTILLYDPDCWYTIPRDWPTRKLSYESGSDLGAWLAKATAPLGHLDKGPSVAHSAFEFACQTGADPIALVGLDLAVPGRGSHAPGVTMTWGGEVDPSGDEFIDLPCVAGGTVRSYPAFARFVASIEVQVDAADARVVNTSPKGALIRGCAWMSLGGFVDGLAAAPCDREALFAGGPEQSRRPFDWAGVVDRLERELKQVRAVARKAGRKGSGGGSNASKSRAKGAARGRSRVDVGALVAHYEALHKKLTRQSASTLLHRLMAPVYLEMRRLPAARPGTPEEQRRSQRQYELAFEGYARAADTLLAHVEALKAALLARDAGAASGHAAARSSSPSRSAIAPTG